MLSPYLFNLNAEYIMWNARLDEAQGKLDMVKQDVARVNINVLGNSELRWTAMGEFNSDGHYIYYCGKHPLEEME